LQPEDSRFGLSAYDQPITLRLYPESAASTNGFEQFAVAIAQDGLLGRTDTNTGFVAVNGNSNF
jgi:hypothetical protein